MKEINESHKISKSKVKYHKSTFDNTSEDRQQKVLGVAIAEFAANGYNATNINTIAKKAGISIGSMYSYFDSKEALFLTAVDKGCRLLEEALKEVDIENGDIFEIFERLLRISRHYAINFPELNQIYLDATTQGLSNLSSKLSRQMESITAELYCEVIKKAKQKGIINPETDEQLVSFCLDNLIVMFQFSFTSDYYKERMKIFLGQDALDDEERIIQGIISFVKKALAK
jgi:AcrR family transcriptional regulator